LIFDKSGEEQESFILYQLASAGHTWSSITDLSPQVFLLTRDEGEDENGVEPVAG